MDQAYKPTALYEDRFWLQILGDHARFILKSLGPKESVEIERARMYMDTFDKLLQQARAELTDEEVLALNQQAEEYTREFRMFKLHLLKRHLISTINIALPPTFLNHMVNELEEFLRVLGYLTEGNVPPPMHPVHHHLLWLADASGHASSITAGLDMVEKRMMEKSRAFAKLFDDLYLKAIEVAGYLRTGQSQFPALSRLNHDAEFEIVIFTQFLEELEELKMSDELLGTLYPLLFDHMAREECYYLTKLAQVSDIETPSCDATKPRVEE